jgi:hypothetical protein
MKKVEYDQYDYAITVGYSINEIWSDLTYVEPHEVKDVAAA